ncbi:MAG: acyl-CoA dehydrogenase family protein, partial [Pseudomonadales bacterium]
MSEALDQFRHEVRDWLAQNFPKSLAGRGIEPFGGVEGEATIPEDASLWRDRLGDKGWGTPTWPAVYGGGGLSVGEAAVLSDEMHQVGA